jgi:hypothetical protein
LSTDTTHGSDGPSGGPHNPSAEPSEEELRAAYEAELSRMTTTDMIAQATVSLLNLGARRLGPEAAGRDLEQARDAIDAARALLEILERRIPQEVAPLRDALSQLQMAYAREVSAAAATGEQKPAEEPAQGSGPYAPAAPAAEGATQPDQQQQRRPGPAESSGKLWVPGR